MIEIVKGMIDHAKQKDDKKKTVTVDKNAASHKVMSKAEFKVTGKILIDSCRKREQIKRLQSIIMNWTCSGRS